MTATWAAITSGPRALERSLTTFSYQGIVSGKSFLGEHGFSDWRFEWPWLHNANHHPYLYWLDPSMPKRNG